MFELATLNELIALKAQHRDKLYPEEHHWGLKQFGTLFCYDSIKDLQGTVLETGAGQNRFFDEYLSPAIDYWAVDSAGFYDEERFKHSASLRKRTTFIDGLVGSFEEKLPSEHFDAIFSISVLEHVPLDNIQGVCQDMYRLLKPGGKIVHTLDLTPDHYETIGKRYEASISEAGFNYLTPPAVDYSKVAHRAYLTEPSAVVFKYYTGVKPEPWVDPTPINQLTATIKIIAQK